MNEQGRRKGENRNVTEEGRHWVRNCENSGKRRTVMFHCKRLEEMRCGQYGKKKTEKHKISRSEENLVGFRSVSLFPARKQETVTRVETMGIDHPTRRITQESVSSKAGKIARTFQIHSHKTGITRAQTPNI